MIGPSLLSLFRAKVPAGLSKKMLDQKSNLASLVIDSSCQISFGAYFGSACHPTDCTYELTEVWTHVLYIVLAASSTVSKKVASSMCLCMYVRFYQCIRG
jgi:hypothetical protein